MKARASRPVAWCVRGLRGGPRAWLAALAVALLLWGPGHPGVRSARGQDEVRNFKRPILTVETGGHHARVRSLAWQDDLTLLSGGEDKVVKVWDFRDGARLARSIRPPIWRGPNGTIYAMALTRPDGQGQSFLAVGGYGVESRHGDLTIFRVPGVEQGPGAPGRIPTGEIVARLLSPPESQPQQVGHRNSVFCLAFDPTGRVLASGSLDTTVILWDVPAFRPRAVLRGHTRDVRTLAFSPDGQRLATAGGDGSVRLWDVATGAPLDLRAGNAQQPAAINTLSFSPDGQALVVGREVGDLIRFDARDLSRVAPVMLPMLPNQGPVEAAAYSPDGRRLAVSIKSDRLDRLDPMALACDVEVRAMPEGNVLRRRRVPGLVYALAFSPRGDRLAYAAGPAQSLFIQDSANLDRPPQELKGYGSTPFDLGFTADSRIVGFTREGFDPANPPATYEAFDLARRRAPTVSRDQLRRAISTFGGWTLAGSILNYRLEALNQGRPAWRFDLSPDTERNWWSYTMIPPGPGHARPTVAVGCESGVVVYDLETGRRTRVFAGHSSPVVSLVPSPDGRWLASSSLDQTILLYPLAGCDTRPRFGAALRRRPDGAWAVGEVEPRGFAAAMGLRPGDVLLRVGIAAGRAAPTYLTGEALAGFAAQADELRPGLDTIAVWVRRRLSIPGAGPIELDLPPMPSTKRNNAALALMLGADKEWVIWTPQGYYDTSIEGDSRYLGWHINAEFRSTRPTDFVPIGTYAATMLRPRVLDRLWQTADPGQALAQAGPPAGAAPPERRVYEARPPRILFTTVERGVRLPIPGAVWTVDIPNPRLGLSIQAEGESRVRARRIIFDERVLERPPVAQPRPAIAEDLRVELVPRRRTRLAVEATNEDGNRRTEVIDMVYIPPVETPAAPARPRLVVLGLGVDRSRDPALLPPIAFADRDAGALADFLSDHVISPDGVRTTQDPSEDRRVLTSERASTGALGRELERLGEWVRGKRLKKGDIVAVVIAAHVLDFDGVAAIAAADTDPARQPAPGPTIAARDVSERLGELADYGCRVVVFLDGVHELPGEALQSTIKPWVRDLLRERRAIVFVASREGPSRPPDERKQQGLFALGVIQAFNQVVAAGKSPGQAYTLEEFGRAVRQEVLDLSGRQQEAFGYFPRGVSPDSPFAQP